MIFCGTALEGVALIDLEPHRDERGFFARAFCEQEFEAHGLPTRYPQWNLSRNERRATLRGMHFQLAPHAEAKLVRVVRGHLYDVVVDLRPDSPTRRRWLGFELSAEEGRMVFVPEGCAHGFLTLTDETDVLYMMTEAHVPTAGRGFRFDDPSIGIEWPEPVAVISDRDAGYPDLGSEDPGS